MKATPHHTLYDVIIAGGGPVGLFLACELALAKCSVLVLEKSANADEPLKRMPFGVRGLSAPSIEILHRRGLLDELQIHKRLKNPHQNSGQGQQRQVGHFAGIPFTEGNVDASQWIYRLPSATAPSLMSEMRELEEIFTLRAIALGVEIKRGLGVTDFHQTEDSVVVQADDQSFQSKWLVGCDGARSAVRKAGGFEFAGTDPEFTGYTTMIDIADPEKLQPGRVITPEGMYLQSQPGYVVIQDFDGGAFNDSKAPITLEHVQETLRRVSGTNVTVTALHAATTWTDRARQATTYRNKRVFLAGDAAHIHAPLGGQGLNLGLGDAVNLGWKLAAVIHNQAPDSLLDTYFTERHPVGLQVLDWSRAQVAIMKPTPEARALNAIIRDLMNTRDGATYFAGRVWGVNTHYNLNGNHPLVGRSVPNFELINGTTVGELMRNGGWTLLDFNGDESLKDLIAGYSDQIQYIDGESKDQLGLTALLIRPDGIIVWVAGGQPDSTMLLETLRTYFK